MPRIVPPNPRLRDDELTLREWIEDDVPAITAACRDPEIPRWTVVPRPYEERHAREFLEGREADLAGEREDLVMVALLAEDVAS